MVAVRGWAASTATAGPAQSLVEASWPILGRPAKVVGAAAATAAIATALAAAAIAATTAGAATTTTTASAAASTNVTEEDSAATTTAAAALAVAEPEWLVRFSAGAPAAEVVQAWLGSMSKEDREEADDDPDASRTALRVAIVDARDNRAVRADAEAGWKYTGTIIRAMDSALGVPPVRPTPALSSSEIRPKSSVYDGECGSSLAPPTIDTEPLGQARARAHVPCACACTCACTCACLARA